MDAGNVLFYIMAALIIFTSLAVVFSANPIHSALYLCGTMISLAFIFFLLNSHFIAGVQLIVYAGAVMVLFVMVLMLFDLKKEINVFAKGRFTGFLKIASAGWLCGMIGGTIYYSSEMLLQDPGVGGASGSEISTKALAKVLYTDYIFAFEILGLLLLLVAVGVVALSRIKGGTHAQP